MFVCKYVCVYVGIYVFITVNMYYVSEHLCMYVCACVNESGYV